MTARRLEPGHSVLIIGAGPAGLTAATEVLARGGVPLVVDLEAQAGGLARTVGHHGNRIDIGGHRFFSRDESIMRWWLDIMPLQGAPSRDDAEQGRRVPLSITEDTPDPELSDRVMLTRTRLSRIYFMGRLFDYPISLSVTTIRALGLGWSARILGSYLMAQVRPIRPERSLADYYVNRFGRRLYELFFEDYTRKVWGVPCTEIGPEWGAQRVKGLSVASAIRHATASIVRRDDSVVQAGTPTTLIGRFLYPKYGPGQLWEAVAEHIVLAGGRVAMSHEVTGLRVENNEIREVRVVNVADGREETLTPEFVMSSMPLSDLIARIEGDRPSGRVAGVAKDLPYRDFITVGLLVSEMDSSITADGERRIPDNWLYMQERDVLLGRLQVFNNWSPYLAADDTKTWLGLEYFCSEGDDLSSLDDATISKLAIDELASLGMIDADSVLDSVVIRVAKAYPGYFGAYADIDVVREYVDSIDNLFVMGRNGMHRYNNMDHSMLSARAAVRAMSGEGTREQVWSVNAEDEHHEVSVVD